MKRSPLFSILVITFGMVITAVNAEQGCYVPMAADSERLLEGDDQQAIYITADQSESYGKSHIKLYGDVELMQGSRLLHAQQAEYQADRQKISASGDIRLSDRGLLLKGEEIVLDAQGEAATIIGGEYQMVGRSGRGGAQKIAIESRQRLLLEGASYTTCPPGDETWNFRAGSIELLPDENTGIAKHMRLEVLGVPVIYLPYINFPLGERKSGILAPSFGSSDTGGDEIEIPFYWNIAPDRDATLTARHLSEHGTLLNSEFRYLTETGYGQLDLQYLDQDRESQQSRHFIQYQSQSFWQAWQARFNLQRASDRDYFRDLTRDKDRISSRLLESRASLDYRDDNWYFSLAFDEFQSIDDQPFELGQPTKRLPQMQLVNNTAVTHWLNYQLNSELAQFEQEDGFSANRLDINQKVSAYFGNGAYYSKPTVGWRATSYRMEDGESEMRQIPMASLDSGLWLEREQQLGEKRYRQTLEPRLYLLYIPYRNQQQLPEQNRLFDTLLSEFDFDSLFNENRYSGVDRIGDERRLSFSISSRWFDQNGRERLLLRAGRIYHATDQRVEALNDEPQLKGWSNLLAGINGRINRYLSSDGMLEWDDSTQALEKAGIELVFERDIKRRVAMGVHYRRGLLKQGNLQARWPLDNHWSVMTDVSHSFLDHQTRNAQLGFEYDGCCWSLRVAAQQYISSNDGTRNSGLAVQFELKGLTSVGSKINGFADGES